MVEGAGFLKEVSLAECKSKTILSAGPACSVVLAQQNENSIIPQEHTGTCGTSSGCLSKLKAANLWSYFEGRKGSKA